MSEKLIEDSIIGHFQCPVCYDFMDKKIYICTNGHSMCKTCMHKLAKCPICKVQLDITRRNINFEKAAKSMKEWISIYGNVTLSNSAIASVARKRTTLGIRSPFQEHLSDEFLSSPHIQCPYATCCFFTTNLLKLKIHIQLIHYKTLRDATNMLDKQQLSSVKLYWDLGSAYSMFLFDASEALFIVYVIRTPHSIQNASHYINVLTVSDQTSMYKFSCGHSSKFCMFYQGQHQAQEGIEVDSGCVEMKSINGPSCYFTKLYIKKVANLFV